MKVDCQWFSSNLEAFICESLGSEDQQLAAEHLRSCRSCRDEVEALRELEPLVKEVLALRMARARAAAMAPTARFTPFKLGLAGAALAVSAGLVFVLSQREPIPPQENLPAITTTAPPANSADASSGKAESLPPTVRAKPDAPDKYAAETKAAPEAGIAANAPEFHVIDPAGYSTGLQDYRGRILVVGVWSADQPEAAQNLQRLYQAFGTRPEVRILGVSRRKEDRPAGTTFPMVFNSGSRLLGARDAEYIVIDKDGKEQMRGSLSGDAGTLIPRIRTRLEQLGAR